MSLRSPLGREAIHNPRLVANANRLPRQSYACLAHGKKRIVAMTDCKSANTNPKTL